MFYNRTLAPPGPPGRLLKTYFANGDLIYLDDNDEDNITYRIIRSKSTLTSRKISALLKSSELPLAETDLLFMAGFHDEAPSVIRLLHAISDNQKYWIGIRMPHPDAIKPTALWTKAKGVIRACDGTVSNYACPTKQVIPKEPFERTVAPATSFFEVLDILVVKEAHGEAIKLRYIEFFLQPISANTQDMAPTFTWPDNMPDLYHNTIHHWGDGNISVFANVGDTGPVMEEIDRLYADGQNIITEINGKNFIVSSRTPLPFEEHYPKY